MDPERIERLKQSLEYIIDAAKHGAKRQQFACDAHDAAWLLEQIELAKGSE